MITLLMALFIVMWAISSVNTSKFKMLRQSLHEAFAGQLTEGGDGVLEGGKQVLQPEGARVQPTEKIQESPDKVLNEKFSRAGGATGK
jgi:chemotaxis protein MotB